MFAFSLILLSNLISGLPMIEMLPITYVHIEGTTIVPHDMMDNILMSNVQNSSNHLHESVGGLQSAIKMLFPKKYQQEMNSTVDRQSLLIGCIFNRAETSEEERRACKGFYEKNDKNGYYEFEDKSLEQKSTDKEIDHLPIHVQHINVARVEDNRKESINNTIEEIRKLTALENRLIDNATLKEKMKLDSISELPSSLNMINQSTQQDMSLNAMDVNRFNNEEEFQWLSNNYTENNLSNIEPVKSNYLNNEQKDDNDKNFKNIKTFSRLDNTSFSPNNKQSLPSALIEPNAVEENNDNNQNISMFQRIFKAVKVPENIKPD
jgi:hypothetical protein